MILAMDQSMIPQCPEKDSIRLWMSLRGWMHALNCPSYTTCRAATVFANNYIAPYCTRHSPGRGVAKIIASESVDNSGRQFIS